MNLQSLLKTALYRLGYSIKRVRSRHTLPPGNEPRAARTAARICSPCSIRADPFAGFDFAARPFDGHGWGSDSPAFRELILAENRGSSSRSALGKAAPLCTWPACWRRRNCPARSCAFDTWLGALEFWTDLADPERYGSLRHEHGWPTVYFQFLANVCHRSLQHRIVPFPQTSAIGARSGSATTVSRGDLIYLDGSHEEDDVYQDVLDYWEVLAPAAPFSATIGRGQSASASRSSVSPGNSGVKISFVADKWVLRKAA